MHHNSNAGNPRYAMYNQTVQSPGQPPSLNGYQSPPVQGGYQPNYPPANNVNNSYPAPPFSGHLNHQQPNSSSYNSYPSPPIPPPVNGFNGPKSPVQSPNDGYLKNVDPRTIPGAGAQFNGFPQAQVPQAHHQPSPPNFLSHQMQGYHQQQPQMNSSSQMGQNYYNQDVNQMTDRMGAMSVNKSWNQMWGQESVNLLTEKNIKARAVQQTSQEEEESVCDRNIIRCTLGKIPETASLLQKSRLPFGLLLHPFKDDEDIPIIQDRTIVRCRSCRTYINPYVRFLDQRRWQCNMCHRVNDLPDDFLIDGYSKRYLEYPPRQPEIMYGSVEFIAPVEYMVRPPQPASYLFVFDCSAHARQLGYVPVLAQAILQSLDMIPGDARTLIGFLGFNSKVHFFNFSEDEVTHFMMPDIQDVFLPFPDGLLVNLRSKKELVEKFLGDLVDNFPGASDDGVVVDNSSALGAALSVAYKTLSPIGGRITVFQATLPNCGSTSDGSVLANREDPNNRSTSTSGAALTPLLNPATDFYKKLALECSEHQIAVDLFALSPSYCDLASVSQVAKISGGSVFYYGNAAANLANCKERVLSRLEADLVHYLTRSIGFESVMRLRCTRGLSIHSFHGNFFVRSTDLLTLPNVNPDSGYAVQIAIEDDLKDFSTICFQAAVLFTNPGGERRIRVHTLSLPVVSSVPDVINAADQEGIVGMLCKMAVDRSLASTLSDARDAAINAVLDLLGTYKNINPGTASAGLVTSYSTRLLPLYVLALLKHPAFRVGISTKVDERVAALEKMKSLPLCYLMTYIYPDLYPVHVEIDFENEIWPQPLQLSFANFERNGVYLLDTHESLYLYICKSVNPSWLSDVFGATQWTQIPDDGDSQSKPATNGSKPIESQESSNIPLPVLENRTSVGLRSFVEFLLDSRPFKPHFFILREDSSLRHNFLCHLCDDRSESAFSYYEFLTHLQQQLKH